MGQGHELAGEMRGELDEGPDVFVYSNNDRGGNAVENALLLSEKLGVKGGVNA